MATGTLSPSPKFYCWDITTGEPLAGGLVYTVSAGGVYPGNAIATFNDVDLDPALHQNTNPIVLNSSGYCVIYLTPGVSYKFIVTDALGVPQWTQDDIAAVPTASPAVDVIGTAGENLAANDAVYLSDGSGSKVAGKWYKADADFTYASSDAGSVGLTLAAITSGSTGSIRVIGQMDYASALTPGALYYVSATAGGLTATAPANRRYIGQADSVSSIVLGPGPIPAATVDNAVCDARLTLTTAVPVTTADVTGATSVFVAPYKGNRMALYDGTSWSVLTFTQLTQALGTLTSGLPYDVFAYNNAGVVATEILAWTNGTTRATALTTQDGVLSKTGALTRRYLGTFYTTSTTQTEDSLAKRLLWNYYNRVPREMRVLEATASWTYTTATLRQANGAPGNQLAFVVGVAEVPVFAQVVAAGENSSAANISVSIGVDSTSAAATGVLGYSVVTNPVNQSIQLQAYLRHYPAVGYHFDAWLETSQATGTTTWRGVNTIFQSGIHGEIMG